MIGKIKAHVDKAVAAVIILACLGVVVWRLVPSGEQSIKPEEVERVIKVVEDAIKTTNPPKVTRPDCVRIFAENMTRTEQLVPNGRVAWVIYPQPPFVLGKTPLKPRANLIAGLGRPAVAPAGVWVGRAMLKVAFSSHDEFWQARALQVWRKPAAEADWPAEPFLTIKVSADGAAALPAGVSAVADGYEIKIEDLKARTPCEYRARVAAVFAAQGKVETTPGKVDIKDVEAPKDPKDAVDFLAEPDDGRRKALESLLGGGGAVKLLAGGPFVTRFSEPAKIELPGDVQVQLVGTSSFDDKDYANISIRCYRPTAVEAVEGWVKTMQRFKADDAIKATRVRVTLPDKDGKPKVVLIDFDSEAKLVSVGPKKIIVRPPKTRTFQDPVTKEIKTEVYPGEPEEREVVVAEIRDKRSGELIQLLKPNDGGDWWPKGLQVAPKAEVKPPVAPKPGPVVAPAPAPAPAPNPPAVVPPVPPPPVPGPNPAVPPGPGVPPPPPTGKEPAVDLTKPLPPDASIELKQAYEKARQEAERKRQLQQSSGLR